MRLTPDLARWLLGADEILEETSAYSDPLRALPKLRRLLSPEQASWAVELTDLRRRARGKFPAAERMFFTRVALEQATDAGIARYKAERFLGGPSAIDLCAGVGGDALAMAAVADAIAVERDEALALMLEANAAVVGVRLAVQRAEAADFPVEQVAAWHCDPDRRPDGHRTVQLAESDPSTETLAALLARNGNAAWKLAPAAELPVGCPPGAEREWIGSGRECRQQVLWWGALRRGEPDVRSATLVDPEGQVQGQIAGSLDQAAEQPAAGEAGRFLYEPHAVVLAAGLGEVLAERWDLRRLLPGIGYWTAPHAIDDPLLTRFEVLMELPPDGKRLQRAIKAEDFRVEEIKIRGRGTLRRESFAALAKHRGQRRITLLLVDGGTSEFPRRLALLAERSE